MYVDIIGLKFFIYIYDNNLNLFNVNVFVNMISLHSDDGIAMWFEVNNIDKLLKCNIKYRLIITFR